MEFLEITNRSTFFHLQPAPLLPCSPAQRRPPLWAASPATSCLRWHPRVALDLSTASTPRAGPLFPLPRHPEATAGRHLAVARPRQSPRAQSLARIDTTRTHSTSSPRPFARSLPRIPRTPPPPARAPTGSSPPSNRLSPASPPVLTP